MNNKLKKGLKSLAISLVILTVMSFCGSAFALGTANDKMNTTYNLTGIMSVDMAKVAVNQVGNTGLNASASSYAEAYCDDFVTDCARQASIPRSVIPNDQATPYGLYKYLINHGGKVVTTPQPGDIIFYVRTSNGNYAHAAVYVGSYGAKNSVQGNIGSSHAVVNCNVNDYTCSGLKVGSGLKAVYVRPNYATSSKSYIADTNIFNQTKSYGGYFIISTDLPALRCAPRNTAEKFTSSAYTKGQIVYCAVKGQNTVGVSHVWYRISKITGVKYQVSNAKFEGLGYYIYKDDLMALKAGTYKTMEGTFLRPNASTSGTKLLTIPSGATIYVQGIYNECFGLVTYNGQTGYILLTNCTFVK